MPRWRLLIVLASAASALAVGLGAEARPEPTTLKALVTAVGTPLGADIQLRESPAHRQGGLETP